MDQQTTTFQQLRPRLHGIAYRMLGSQADAGESEQRLYALDAWRETPFYSTRERAALAWTEALTCVADSHVPDAEYEAARGEFSEQELVDLTLVIVAINSWNRICVGFRAVPGTYQPEPHARERVS
jgi:alkylhydroperoxidase family enzyme